MTTFLTIIFSIFAFLSSLSIFPMEKTQFESENIIIQAIDQDRLNAQELFAQSSTEQALETFVDSIKGDAEEVQKILNVLFLRELIVETTIALHCEYVERESTLKDYFEDWDQSLFSFFDKEQEIFSGLSPASKAFFKEFDKQLKKNNQNIAFSKFKTYVLTRKMLYNDTCNFIDQFLTVIKNIKALISKEKTLDLTIAVFRIQDKGQQQRYDSFLKRLICILQENIENLNMAEGRCSSLIQDIKSFKCKPFQIEARLSNILHDIKHLCIIFEDGFQPIDKKIGDKLIDISQNSTVYKSSNSTLQEALNSCAQQYALLKFLPQGYQEHLHKIKQVDSTNFFEKFLEVDDFRNHYAILYKKLHQNIGNTNTLLFPLKKITETEEGDENETQLPQSIFRAYSFLSSNNCEERLQANSILAFFIQHGKYLCDKAAFFSNDNNKGSLLDSYTKEDKINIRNFLSLLDKVNPEIKNTFYHFNLPVLYATKSNNLRSAVFYKKSFFDNIKSVSFQNIKVCDAEELKNKEGIRLSFATYNLLAILRFYDKYAKRFSSKGKNKKKKKKAKVAQVPVNNQSQSQLTTLSVVPGNQDSQDIEKKEESIDEQEVIEIKQEAPSSKSTKKRKRKKTQKLQVIVQNSEILLNLFDFHSFNVAQHSDYAVIHHWHADGQPQQKVIFYLNPQASFSQNKNVEVKKCSCASCKKQYPGSKIKGDRYHTIPSAIRHHMSSAYKLTKADIETDVQGIHNELSAPLYLNNDEYALVLEARIINNIYFPSDQAKRIQTMSIRGHHHGAYVFIYNQDGHCKHAMFHETVTSAQLYVG